VEKNTDKIQVCIYFRNLNKANPKNEYPMPINNTSGHQVISFLNGNTCYDQFFMDEV
jgi:hypothetical protein